MMLIIIRCSIIPFGETVKPFLWEPANAEVQKQIKVRSKGAPAHHSYTAEVEMVIDGKATGALVLFYNGSASSGILANSENILANIYGWQFETEKKVIKNHVFLRLKNINNTVVSGKHGKPGQPCNYFRKNLDLHIY